MNLRTSTTILALAAAAVAGSLRAQATKGLLSTVGTVVEHVDEQSQHHHYAYILWQPDKAATTFGKRFAIYRKSGNIDSTAAYRKLGVQTLQTSPKTIRAMLRLGDKVDFDPGAGAGQIAKVYQSITLQLGAAPGTPADPNLDASGKLAYIIKAASAHPEVLDQLFFLGRARPGVMLALGHAFAIEVPATGVATYELREIDAGGADVRVLGRVTLDSADPPSIPAPGRPISVPHEVKSTQFILSPKDNLNACLRWSIGEPLRRKMALTSGFDLFRVRKDFAVEAGWNSNPPSAAVLAQTFRSVQNLENPPIVRPNKLPVLPTRILTEAQAADVAHDRETFFYADDNGIPKHPAFHDGDEFYYFVAARTITGHPGTPSPGTLVQMCDRIPPDPPSIAGIENVFADPSTAEEFANQGGAQHLRVKIRQLPPDDPNHAGEHGEDPLRGASEYRIYRWSNPKQYLIDGGDPDAGYVGTVAHVPGETFVYFDDTGANAPSNADAGMTFWYTVRAVDTSACVRKNYSAHSGPAYGVIRDRRSPASLDGGIKPCRYKPVATFTGRNEVSGETQAAYGSDGTRREVRVQVHRDSSGIASFDVLFSEAFEPVGGVYRLSRVVASLNVPFHRGIDDRGLNFLIDTTNGEVSHFVVQVRGVSATGLRGEWAQAPTTGPEDVNIPYPLPVYGFSITATKVCTPPPSPQIYPKPQDRVDPDGHIVPLPGWLTFSPDVHEWRVYRRVGSSGPLTLIKKGHGDVLPSPVDWEDAHLPAAPGSTVCYFGQVFDENGNPSELQPLGCIVVASPALAVPIVEPPVLLEKTAAGKGRVRLRWFCDPAGVDRFQVLAASKGGSALPIVCDELSGPVSNSVLLLAGARKFKDGSDPKFHVYPTNRISGTLGKGPQFSVTMEVPLTGEMRFSVRAVGVSWDAAPVLGGAGNVVEGQWIEPPPAAPGAVIPWPVRPFPALYEVHRDVTSYTKGEGPLWATKLRNPHSADPDFNWHAAAGIFVGMFEGGEEFAEAPGSATRFYAPLGATPETGFGPEKFLFGVRASNSDGDGKIHPLMPFMLYRYQLPSDRFPNAVPNLVQCTPLLDRMSWKYEGTDTVHNKEYYSVSDPFFLFLRGERLPPDCQFPGSGVPVAGSFSRNPSVTLGRPDNMPDSTRPHYADGANNYIFVLDRMPVIRGAKYQYLIVRFDKRGEIRDVIPVNPVQQ